jgi:hypothetical protein
MLKPEVFQFKDQYVFSVEVYKPYYRAETRMDYDYYGRPTPYTYNIFDGYKFYDLILTGLSQDGELVWNNDFVIKDLKSYNLEHNCIVFEDREDLIKKLKQALAMDKDEIGRMRGNVLDYYDNFLRPDTFVRRIETSPDKKVIVLIITESNVARCASKLGKHSVLMRAGTWSTQGP